MRTLITIFLCLFVSLSSTLSGNAIFKHITLKDGLAHSDANCMVQDSCGLIWIGTNGGLQCYDGYSLQTFDYYKEEQNIFKSHNRIFSMALLGNRIWMGTDSGLTCFDLNKQSYVPYSFYNDDECERSVRTSFSHVFTSVIDGVPFLWLKNKGDLLVFKIQNDALVSLKWNSEEERLMSKKMNTLEFHDGKVWAVSSRKIYILSVNGEKVAISCDYDIKSLTGRDSGVSDIFIKDDFLYLRMPDGCFRLSLADDKIYNKSLSFVNFSKVDKSIPEETKGCFLISDQGSIWCAYEEGLFEIQYPFSERPSARTYLKNVKDERRSTQKIKDMLIDRYKNLWVATASQGVYYHVLSEPFFRNVSNADFSSLGFSQNEIVSITGGDDGIFYMIVEYGSLLSYDIDKEELVYIPLQDKLKKNRYLQCVRKSKFGNYLYIGTDKGVFIYDIENENIRNLNPDSGGDSYKINTSIADMQEDNAGRLWIATWGLGLLCIDNPLGNAVQSLYLSADTDPAIVSDRVSSLYLRKNTLYICTAEGLNRMELTSNGKIKSLSSYKADIDKGNSSMSSDYLAAIDCVNDSVCWIGTIGGGVNKLVLHSDDDNDYTATVYTKNDGLQTNDCEIVMVDNTGNVWIGGNGLNCLDTNAKRIYSYGYSDGLRDNAFKINSFHKTEDGMFFMGGLYGLSYFRPELFATDNNDYYPLVFINLFVNNQKIMPDKEYDGNVVLANNINNTSELRLNYKQNNFSLSFSALDYKLSDKIMYRYRLSGFHGDWQVLHQKMNEIYFSNLPYGSYRLDIQFSTDSGYSWESQDKCLDIKILPPWWLTGWAKFLYVVIVFTILFYSLRQYKKELKLKKENEIQKILIEQDEEKYQAKMQFFMNASHELKTPLTLIMLSAEKLQENNVLEKECHTILYNVKRMLKLISELVDIRKQDLGISTLNLEKINMTQLITGLFAEITPWAENKNITIGIHSSGEEIELDGDRDKLGKMILNLFSNAIKYTNEGGCIDVSFMKGTKEDIRPCFPNRHCEGELYDDAPLFIFTVKDSGIGISSDSISKIYERFFQLKGASQSHLGSGIGLAIVKNVVLQHKGEIVVSSERNEGSEFIVAIPIIDKCKRSTVCPLQKNDISEFVEEQYYEFDSADCNGYDTEICEQSSDKPVLLIVEDNKGLQMMLKEHFSDSYNVYVADNGKIGLDMCLELYPDAVVSDVMMPVMDGIEFCKCMKENLSVGYIPFVMLTAKDMVESQIEGYESGADLYISKPFSMKLLEVNLHRLIAQREKWLKNGTGKDIKSYSPLSDNDGVLVDKDICTDELTKEQQRMIERLRIVVEEHLDNPDLSPDFLARELRVSRTKLYRDIKRIDGYSLSDYLRNVRLEKAAELLTNSDLNVQEVMNDVGFVNSSHFSKIFKLKFGVSPTEYKRNN